MTTKNYTHMDMAGHDFSGQNLEQAVFCNASLRQADFSGAKLRGADMRHANLAGAVLTGADITDVNLHFCTGDGVHIKNIETEDMYPIAYTATHLHVDGQCHLINDWWQFSDREIQTINGDRGLMLWKKWKNSIRSEIERNPAN